MCTSEYIFAMCNLQLCSSLLWLKILDEIVLNTTEDQNLFVYLFIYFYRKVNAYTCMNHIILFN